MRVWPGKPYPLGATWDGAGVNFALFSEHATAVELCLFDSGDTATQSDVIRMPEQTDQVWHCYLPDARPGLLYGYRLHGPYAPEQGHRFNPAKIVLDPYAAAIGRDLQWDDSCFGYRIGDGAEDLSCDQRDNLQFAPLAEVIDPAFTWGNDAPPNTPWHKTLIYEAHVKGLTMLHPEVDPRLRGTYAAIASDPIVKHLKSLNVTAVELLPVHYFLNDRHLEERNLKNYWGYNTLGFFAPAPRYATNGKGGDSVREFKTMVRTLHAAGIEVILDVVYNHTAEGNHLGPTLSFRGIDNLNYYRTVLDSPRYYMDYTGCGNTLNMRSPKVLQLIMDSLRYWTLEMHVDGFRFDLASSLARELHEVDKLSAFFEIIHQDPVLSRVKLIAEPWDLGVGGYQVGNFPVGWTEWNGEYRDAVRSFWKGDGATVNQLATRLSGSPDFYQRSGRLPYASINFITCHDGFTLQDLVSFNGKHNEANREENRDGNDNNLSWNCGEEGRTGNPEVLALRERQKRNLLATLFVSQGVPMLLAGDELSHSQEGNNNTYCQDNELAWLNWELSGEANEFLTFTRKIAEIWRTQPVLKRRNFLQGRAIRGSEIKDVTWLNTRGEEMTEAEWNMGFVRCFGVRWAGDVIAEVDEQGNTIVGDTLLLLFNAHFEPMEFSLPLTRGELAWELLLDTSGTELTEGLAPQAVYRLEARSLAVLRVPPASALDPQPR